MLPDGSLLAAFAIASLAVILLPGPDTIYVVSRSVGQGRKAGMVATLGISSGLVIHLTAATLGISGLFLYAPLAYDVIRYLGVLYLLYLAWRAFTDADVDPLAFTADTARRRLSRAWSEALLTNLFNPKIVIFFIAFLPQFADPAKGSIPLQIFSLGLCFMVAGLLYMVVIALTFGLFGNWLKQRPLYWRIQRWTMGTALGGLAVWLALPDRR
ncbi:MAG: LysE family translocator [Rhodospirillales bacterium]|nr:LysE family translocator [Rhodospirillales bacterium]